MLGAYLQLLLFIVALLAAFPVLACGWIVLLAGNAWLKGQPVKPLIQPLLDEF